MSKEKKNVFQDWKGYLRSAVFLSIGFILIAMIFRNQDWGKLTAGFQQVNYRWIIFSALSGLFAHYMRGVRWRLQMAPLGYHPPNNHLFYAVMNMNIANFAIPRSGELIRCLSLYKTDRIVVEQSLGTVIMERIIDLLSIAVVLFLAFLLNMSLISNFMAAYVLEPVQQLWYRLTGNNIWILLGIALLSLLAFLFIKRQAQQSGIFNSIYQRINGLKAGIFSILKMDQKGRFILYTIVIWLCYFLSFYLYKYCLPVSSSFTMGQMLFVFSVSTLAMILPIQGGIGAYHFLAANGFALLGATFEEGLVLATVIHSVMMLGVITVGIGTILRVFVFTKEPVVSEYSNSTEQRILQEKEYH